MSFARFVSITFLTGILAACTHPARDVNDDWQTRNTNATAKDFAWAAVGCGVPRSHWEVNGKLEIQRFSTSCMHHYGYHRSSPVRWPDGDGNPVN